MTDKRLKAILVDDEASAHKTLGNLLTRFCSEVEIIGHVTSVDEAVQQIQKHQPDVVFLDIEMPGKSGFELLKAFTPVHFHIVFVTAYNQYAIKAFEVSAMDYLLKPVVVERLQEAVAKVMLQQKREDYKVRFEALKSNTGGNTFKKLAIPQRNDCAVINIEDIIAIEADGMYSTLLVSYGPAKTITKYTYAKKLRYFENLFEQLPHLYRVHRSWMINTRYINAYSKKDCCISLKNKLKIPVSKSHKKAFETFLGV